MSDDCVTATSCCSLAMVQASACKGVATAAGFTGPTPTSGDKATMGMAKGVSWDIDPTVPKLRPTSNRALSSQPGDLNPELHAPKSPPRWTLLGAMTSAGAPRMWILPRCPKAARHNTLCIPSRMTDLLWKPSNCPDSDSHSSWEHLYHFELLQPAFLEQPEKGEPFPAKLHICKGNYQLPLQCGLLTGGGGGRCSDTAILHQNKILMPEKFS